MEGKALLFRRPERVDPASDSVDGKQTHRDREIRADLIPATDSLQQT